MDSVSPWSTPRNHYSSPTLRKLSEFSTPVTDPGFSPITTNVETLDGTSATGIKSPTLNNSTNEKNMVIGIRFTTNSTLANGRPCVAGTQTIQHHNKDYQINSSNGVDFNNSSITNTNSCDITNDSSGIGSLLCDPHNSSSISGIFKSNEQSDQHFYWVNQNFINTEAETSDLSLDKSDDFLISTSIHENSNIRNEYTNISRCTKQHSSHDINISPSLESSNKSLIQDASSDEFDYDAMITQTQLLAGQESQMLDENLASVARYVEELTGCCNPPASTNNDNLVINNHTKNKTTTKYYPSIKQSSHHHQQQHHHHQTPPQQQQQLHSSQSVNSYYPNQTQLNPLICPQLTQLQQLYNKLNSINLLKNTKPDDKNAIDTQAYALLLRLLNYPNNEFRNSFSKSNGLVSSIPNHNARPLFSPANKFSSLMGENNLRKMNRRIFKNDILTDNECSVQSPISSCMDMQTNFDGFKYGGTIGTMPTIGIENMNQNKCLGALQAILSTLNPNILANLLTQLNGLDSTLTHNSGISSQQNSSTTNNTNNILFLLTSLLNANQPQSFTSTTNLNLNSQEHYNQITTALTSLINNLQSVSSNAGLNLNESRFNNNSSGSVSEHGGSERTSSFATTTIPDKDCLNGNTSISQVVTSSKSSLSEELSQLAVPYQQLLSAFENDIDKAANVYRNSASTVAQTSEAAYHWSGKLPMRVYRSMTFSRKVFLGGVPWDSTSEDLVMAFSIFGNVTISWPQKESIHYNNPYSRSSSTKGYCYLIFEHESSVSELLANCVHDPSTEGDYYKISSPKFKSKDVQVIPWVISDSQYTKSGPYGSDAKRTVFVGALHGMITAEALVTIMNDLFGNVLFAALDTDKYKYPIGSGRVVFSSHKSYMKAVTANFVDIRTSKFIKTIQIDPYLEDAVCSSCFSCPGMYFCRAFECFRYFCPACWQLWHNSTETLYTHKPLRRTFKPISDRHYSGSSRY